MAAWSRGRKARASRRRFQERYGYPELTWQIQGKILGADGPAGESGR
jgi:hypothetical protein